MTGSYDRVDTEVRTRYMATFAKDADFEGINSCENRTFAEGNGACFESNIMLSKHNIRDWNSAFLSDIETIVDLA